MPCAGSQVVVTQTTWSPIPANAIPPWRGPGQCARWFRTVPSEWAGWALEPRRPGGSGRLLLPPSLRHKGFVYGLFSLWHWGPNPELPAHQESTLALSCTPAYLAVLDLGEASCQARTLRQWVWGNCDPCRWPCVPVCEGHHKTSPSGWLKQHRLLFFLWFKRPEGQDQGASRILACRRLAGFSLCSHMTFLCVHASVVSSLGKDTFLLD